MHSLVFEAGVLITRNHQGPYPSGEEVGERPEAGEIARWLCATLVSPCKRRRTDHGPAALGRDNGEPLHKRGGQESCMIPVHPFGQSAWHKTGAR